MKAASKLMLCPMMGWWPTNLSSFGKTVRIDGASATSASDIPVI